MKTPLLVRSLLRRANRNTLLVLTILFAALILFVVGLIVRSQHALNVVTVYGEPGLILYPNYDDYDAGAGEEPVAKTIPGSGRLTLKTSKQVLKLLAYNGEDYNPWAKNLYLGAGARTVVYPFSLPVAPEDQTITKDSEQFSQIEAAFDPAAIPTKEEPLLSSDGTMGLYLDNDIITLEWQNTNYRSMPDWFCSGEKSEECSVIPVFDLGLVKAAISAQAGSGASSNLINTELTGVSFYGRHDELIMFSNTNGVYVLEIDRRDNQNFSPFYQGDLNPRFMVRENDVVVKGQSGFHIFQR